jgi:hypothetical protein
MCVQIALKHAAVLSVGRATITGEPSGSFADEASPTEMSANFASGVPAAALGALDLGGDGGPPDPQAASATPPAPATPATRTERRVTARSWSMHADTIRICLRFS